MTRTAVVITTFDVESLALGAHLDEPAHRRRHREERGTLYEIGTFTGKHGQWTVCLAEVGPGNSTAGIEVERASAVFAPDIVLLVGVAGGLKDLRRGDVVAADAVYDYESGKQTASGYLPRIKTHSSSRRLLQHAQLVARHGTWHRRIRTADQDPPPRAVVKPVAAGGKLVADDRSHTAELLRRYCSDAVAVEMEGYGFLRGAYLNPRTDVIVVRGISDLLSDKDQTNDERWQSTAAGNAAAFGFAVLDSVSKAAGTDTPAGPSASTNPPGLRITGSSGVQIGNHNTQHNTWLC